jgi:hypothetical protein
VQYKTIKLSSNKQKLLTKKKYYNFISSCICILSRRLSQKINVGNTTQLMSIKTMRKKGKAVSFPANKNERAKIKVNSYKISGASLIENCDNYLSMEYSLEKFHRSNQDTCLVHKPSVVEGQWVESGDLLADCSASVGGELALGQNILIGYMPWEGYNFEDAILISERLVYDDLYTSIHIERYEVNLEETKLGMEEITREIPEVESESLKNLNSLGIVKIGSWVQEGDILVGKVTPVNKKNQTNYQKLLYLILDKTVSPFRDSSLRAPKGIKAKVIGIQIFKNASKQYSMDSSTHKKNSKKISPLSDAANKKEVGSAQSKTGEHKSSKENGQKQNSVYMAHKKNVKTDGQQFNAANKKEIGSANSIFHWRSSDKNGGGSAQSNFFDSYKQKTNSLLNAKKYIESFSYKPSAFALRVSETKKHFKEKISTKINDQRSYAAHNSASFLSQKNMAILGAPLNQLRLSSTHISDLSKERAMSPFVYGQSSNTKKQLASGEASIMHSYTGLSRGKREVLVPANKKKPRATQSLLKEQKPMLKGVSSIQVYLAERRRVQVGDKMAGRHGNKGIISEILPIEDLPFLPDGTPLDMVLNPLGVPSRMNVGQIYECLLGLAGKHLGENYKVFPFDEIYGAEASRSFVYSKLYNASIKTGKNWLFNPNIPGKIGLYDGRTGESFHQTITVGYAYILRLVHMVDDKMHCLTPDHDVLTSKGWRSITKINWNDEVATLKKNGILSYQKPTNIFEYKNYKGPLYHIKNNSINLLVTPNHRMYVRKSLALGDAKCKNNYKYGPAKRAHNQFYYNERNNKTWSCIASLDKIMRDNLDKPVSQLKTVSLRLTSCNQLKGKNSKLVYSRAKHYKQVSVCDTRVLCLAKAKLLKKKTKGISSKALVVNLNHEQKNQSTFRYASSKKSIGLLDTVYTTLPPQKEFLKKPFFNAAHEMNEVRWKANRLPEKLRSDNEVSRKANRFPLSSYYNGALGAPQSSAKSCYNKVPQSSIFDNYELIEAKDLIGMARNDAEHGQKVFYLKNAIWPASNYQFFLDHTKQIDVCCDTTSINDCPHVNGQIAHSFKTNTMSKKIVGSADMRSWLTFIALWVSGKWLITYDIRIDKKTKNLFKTNYNIKTNQYKSVILDLLKDVTNKLGYKYTIIDNAAQEVGSDKNGEAFAGGASTEFIICDNQLGSYLLSLTDFDSSADNTQNMSNSITLNGGFLEVCIVCEENKNFPSWIWKLSQKQARFFLTTLCLAINYNNQWMQHAFFENNSMKSTTWAAMTGYRGTPHLHTCRTNFNQNIINLYISSLKLSDDLMRLALHAGWSANIVGNNAVQHYKQEQVVPERKKFIKANIHARYISRINNKQVSNLGVWQISIIKSQNNPVFERNPFYKRADHPYNNGLLTYSAKTIPSFFKNSGQLGGKRTLLSSLATRSWGGPSANLRKIQVKLASSKATNQDNFRRCWRSMGVRRHLRPITSVNPRPTLGQRWFYYSQRTVSTIGLAESTKWAASNKTSRKPLYGQKPHIEKIIQYKGPVFCLTVPNEVFYVRRHGIPVWTGNSRSTGPYSLVTQQPLRGRSKHGGQRLGEMEVWALEGYGAAFTLLEMLTIKSDDMSGRMTLWSNLILNKEISIGTPESFKVLICELQALCLDIGLFRISN